VKIIRAAAIDSARGPPSPWAIDAAHWSLPTQGDKNTLLGGRHPDKIAAYGDYNRLHGHTEDDSLWVPAGFAGNLLDGGPHISTDTCGDCFFSTCMNCAP